MRRLYAGTDPSSDVDLSSQVSNGCGLVYKPGDNSHLLNNLITHGDGLIPIYKVIDCKEKKKTRRKQTRRSRRSRHKKNSYFTNKSTVNASNAIISTLHCRNLRVREVWNGSRCCSLIALKKEDKDKHFFNAIELFDNVRSKSDCVPDGMSLFQKMTLGDNLMKLLDDNNIKKKGVPIRYTLDPAHIKHKYFIMVTTIGNLRRSEYKFLVNGRINLLNSNPTKLLTVSKRMRLEVSYSDRSYQFSDCDFIVLGIFFSYQSPVKFNEKDALVVKASKPNVCQHDSHFGSGGYVASFGTRASYGALGSNGQSVGQYVSSKLIFNVFFIFYSCSLHNTNIHLFRTYKFGRQV